MKRSSLTLPLLIVIYLCSLLPAEDVPKLRNLPKLDSIDKVELLNVTTEKGSIIKAVIASKSFQAKEVSPLIALWGRQAIYEHTASACHNPVYAIKFYSQEQVILFASICWECNNMNFLVPASNQWAGFQGNSKAGQELRELFAKSFPNESHE